MNMKEELTCQYCNNIYMEPITLRCCFKNICKHHIEELFSSSTSNKFKCPLCNEENTNQTFKANKIIEKLVQIELDAFKLDPKYEKVLNDLKIEIEKLAAILKDPENYIYEEISELKRKVDLDKEILKCQIDEIADDLIQQLESFGNRFKTEYKSNVDFDYYNDLVESSKKQLAEYEQCLNLFSDEIYEDCEGVIKFLQPSLIEIRNKLLSNLSITYQPMDNKMEGLLGKLKIKETEKTNNKESFGMARKTLTGHFGAVFALAVLKNGDLISGSSDNTLKIWSISDGKVKQTLNGHADTLRNILVLDENFIINAANDHTIKIRNLNDSSINKTLKGHKCTVRALVLLKNGDLASGSVDRTIKIWNIKEGTVKRTLTGHDGSVWSLLKLTNDDLVSGSADSTIKIWDIDVGVVKKTLAGHTSHVYVLDQLKNGDLVSGSWDKTIKIWNIEDGTVKRTLNGHISFVLALKVLGNGDLASGSPDKTIKIWDVDDGVVKKEIKLNSAINFFYGTSRWRYRLCN